ncbi:hypothetical protein FKP32DRAFT_1569567 [Trametes sanguinea]|nr:hypothetical protein FKP32DRAFT_1569567 [Trametes sanguinea]
MRQRGMSEDDVAFKRALENMRYARCTKHDEALLSTRICRPWAGDKSLSEDRFRNVSIITARNAYRDAINDILSRQFAADAGLRLEAFHSIDSWGKSDSNPSLRQTQKDYDSVVDPIRDSDVIGDRLQKVLWSLPPNLSKHHAGVLRLCRGMPVLLKQNVATELCITNGAEAVVVDWDARTTSGGVQVLETLYVRLIDPPRPLQLPGLSVNEVPLTRTKKTVQCTLPVKDLPVSVQREQVTVLPNFAMSDFACQGRTRPDNVVHLKYCDNHQSIYTCLSRSSSLAGTLILDSFDMRKIRGGASTGLRTEYRELELLDEITALRETNALPAHVSGQTRGALLKTFTAWKGVRYVPRHVHSALDWSSAPESELTPPMNTERREWLKRSIVYRDEADAKDTNRAQRPSKRPAEDWVPSQPKRPRNATAYDVDVAFASQESALEPPSRAGLVWDTLNWSCAFDSILTVLFNIFVDRGCSWLAELAPGNLLMEVVRPRFQTALSQPHTLHELRDLLRHILFAADAARFPRYGESLVAVSDIFVCLFTCASPYAQAKLTCEFCSAESLHLTDMCKSYQWSMTPAMWTTYKNSVDDISTQTFVHFMLNSGFHIHCPTCRTLNQVTTSLSSAPSLLILEPPASYDALHADLTVTAPVEGRIRTWRLVGIIYFGWQHFTARYIDKEDRVWYHDGQVTKEYCIEDRVRREVLNSLSVARNRRACHYIYALDSVVGSL